jgi:hypothetical protein
MEGNETFEPSALGTCDEVAEERVADDNMLVLRGCKWVYLTHPAAGAAAAVSDYIWLV